jgi:transposase
MTDALEPPVVRIGITGGAAISRIPGGFSVPKIDLVGAPLALMQNDRLHVAESLKLQPTLVKELLNFRRKININTPNATYEAWREGDHDDLMLFLALVHLQYRFRVVSYSSAMKSPIFVRSLSEKERETLQAGLRSKDAFTLRRSQMLLASSRREEVPQIAKNLGCGQQTVRDAIHDFNARGVQALMAKSSRPRRTRDAFDEQSAEALRGLLHRCPREFGHQSSLWTLEMAAEVAFEEGITQRRVSGETIRATLSRLLGVRWQRAKRWITSPDPLYERKKDAATG